MTTTEHTEQDRILDFGGFPGRWEILRSTEDTDGELLEMRWEIEETPEEGPFVHTHPGAEERYDVQSGVLEVSVEGDCMELEAGEQYAVPPGTPHTFVNKTPVEVINVHEPALDHETFFRRFHRLVVEEGVSLPPDGLRDAILLAMLTVEHETDVRAVSPPHLAFKGLTLLGKLLRYDLPD